MCADLCAVAVRCPFRVVRFVEVVKVAEIRGAGWLGNLDSNQDRRSQRSRSRPSILLISLRMRLTVHS